MKICCRSSICWWSRSTSISSRSRSRSGSPTKPPATSGEELGSRVWRSAVAPRATEIHRGSASEAIIQGSLPRPAELEVYLGDAGIFCRPINKDENGEEVTVGATADAPGTPLYIF